MLELVKSKKLVPTVDSERKFDDILSALEEMRNSAQFGKIVVQMAGNLSKI
jgi:D-arabinose 1-dehydrogenase-like Zn-dependent alcohol dehydrogenase